MMNRIVMVTCERDLAVNRLTIPAVLDSLEAKHYFVVVPDREVSVFRSAMPSIVDIVAEHEVLPDWSIGQISRCLPERLMPRSGWYLQQFLKIEIASQCPADELALIWDADTVPLRPLSFEDSSGRIGLYTGKEYHAPYFQTIETLLGIGRRMPGSFIAQCMCVRPKWLLTMIRAIESHVGANWIDGIMQALPKKVISEFSEYETIGSFVFAHFSSEVFFNQRPWFRWGGGYFGGIERVNQARLKNLARIYDFVALERWDRGYRAWVRSRRSLASKGTVGFRLMFR